MWTSTVAAPVRTLGAKFPTVTECQAPSALNERRLILHSDPLQVQVEGPSLRHPLPYHGTNLDNDVRRFGIFCPLLELNGRFFILLRQVPKYILVLNMKRFNYLLVVTREEDIF